MNFTVHPAGGSLPKICGVSSMAELQSSKLRTMGSIPSRRSTNPPPDGQMQ
jgi:hypothetical protein